MLTTSHLQADLLRDLLDDLSDSEPTPPSDARPGQTSAAAADAAARTEGTAQPREEHEAAAGGAAASEAAAAPAPDVLQPGDSGGEGVPSLPDDVLLSVLRRCARADWLALACSCRALRAAAAQDGLWLSQPELQPPASSAASSSQQPAGPSVITLESPHGRPASAPGAAASRTAPGGTAAPGVPPRKRKRVTADASDDRPTQGPMSASSRPSGAGGLPAAVPATNEEEEEQEPGVGSGGTYLGMSGPGSGGGTEGCETATVGRCLQDPCGAGGMDTRAQPNGTRLYYQRGAAARGQQRSLQAALRRGFAATAWLGNLGGASVRAEPDQAALPLSVVAGASGSPCLRYASGSGALAVAYRSTRPGCSACVP